MQDDVISIARIVLYVLFSIIGNKMCYSESVVYYEDGVGVHLYDVDHDLKRLIYQCSKETEQFGYQQMICFSNAVVFSIRDDSGVSSTSNVLYNSAYRYYYNSTRSNESTYLGMITYSRKSNEIIERLDIKLVVPSDIFSCFPKNIAVACVCGSPLDISDITLSLFGSDNCKGIYFYPSSLACKEENYFYMDLVLKDFLHSKEMVIKSFKQRTLPLQNGGGGYMYPSLCKGKDMATYLVFPEQTFWKMLFQYGAFLAEFRIINIDNKEETIVAMLDFKHSMPIYPKLSMDRKFVAYERTSTSHPQRKSEQIVLNLRTGEEKTIGIGHSIHWCD